VSVYASNIKIMLVSVCGPNGLLVFMHRI